FRQRHGLVVDAVQAAIHLVETVGDVRKQQWLRLLEKTVENMRQHFVGAITDKYLVGLYVVKTGNGLAQRRGIRVRIKTQAVRRHPGNGGQGLRRRAVGIFVGVQLDQSLDLWLFAGHIGLELVNKIAPVTAHALLRLNKLWNSPEIIRRSRGRAFPQT